jgi:hypothetical protein
MAAPTATYSTLDLADYTADGPLKEGKLKLLLQNDQWFGTLHDHSGDTGDGGTIVTSNPIAVLLYGAELGAAFS